MNTHIFHLTDEADLRRFRTNGLYHPPSLEEHGFIHFTAQPWLVLEVAADYFQASTPLPLVLSVDPRRLDGTLRYEPPFFAAAVPPGHTRHKILFPHLYAPLNWSAVVEIGRLGHDGHAFQWPTRFQAATHWQ